VMQGDVTVKGGAAVRVSSTTGKILVDGAKGGVDAETAADEIRLLNVAGDVTAESAGGDIILVNALASSVDVGTIGGRVYYDGVFQKGGTYFLGTHGGTITLVVPQGAAASFIYTDNETIALFLKVPLVIEQRYAFSSCSWASIFVARLPTFSRR